MSNTRFAEAWERAESTSVVWRATAPVRQIWLALEAMFARAIAPRSVAGDDLRALNVVKASALVGALEYAIDTTAAAWRHSWANAVFLRAANRVTPLTAPSRVRLGGVLTASASTTVLIVRLLTPRPEPMTWIVPALFLCIGICAMVGTSDRSRR
jgi:hypothetical protein